MRRALLGCFGLVCLTAALSSPAGAVERELAGVRLGAKAVTLLTRAGFGQPGFIGPLGVVGGQAVASTAARSGPAGAAGATRAGGQGGMRGGQGGMRGGQGGMRGGQGGMRGGMGGMRGALTPGTRLASSVGGPVRFDVELTQMRGGGMRGGMGGGQGGMRGGQGGMRGGGGGGQGMRGGGGGRAAGAATTARAGAGAPSTLYWLYRRTAGTTLVLSINLKGYVTAITLTGSAPYAAGRTSLGVGLATSYGDVIRRYGFPDQSTANGTVLDVTYVDAGVRFRLDSMRVTQITVGGTITAAATPAAPTTTAPSAPTPGLSVDELKSYM